MNKMEKYSSYITQQLENTTKGKKTLHSIYDFPNKFGVSLIYYYDNLHWGNEDIINDRQRGFELQVTKYGGKGTFELCLMSNHYFKQLCYEPDIFCDVVTNLRLGDLEWYFNTVLNYDVDKKWYESVLR